MTQPVSTPDLSLTNNLLAPFGFQLIPERDGYRVDGWSHWTTRRIGSNAAAFPTLAHFWAEWMWFGAGIIGEFRRMKSFSESFSCAAPTERQRLLGELQCWSRGKDSTIETEFPPSELRSEHLEDNWLQELQRALASPHCGASFGSGAIYAQVRSEFPSDWHAFLTRPSRA